MHTIADLLAHGYDVRGTVRSVDKAKRDGSLAKIPGQERLDLVAADLMSPGSFDAAALGCDAVLHMASPYVINVADAQRDLVDPAVNGTRSVLAAAAAAPTVKRVVVTSSMAAITDELLIGRTLTEADWNTKSSLTRNPYYYSKTMAERAAWAFVEENKPGFDVVAINPFMVIGPSYGAALNESNKIIADIITGAFPVVMDLAWGFVDVRDVARAHVLALEKPAAKGRYLCAGDVLSMREVVGVLRGVAPKARLPSLGLDNGAGTAMMKLASYAQPKGVGTYLRSHLGRRPVYDTSKIKRDLGLSFRDARTTIAETVADLARWGHIKL